MLIRVDDPTLTSDLALYLRRCEFSVRELENHVVDVEPIRGVTDRKHLRIEVDAFLRVWRAMNGGAHAVVLEPA
jgi:hypothetical protein